MFAKTPPWRDLEVSDVSALSFIVRCRPSTTKSHRYSQTYIVMPCHVMSWSVTALSLFFKGLQGFLLLEPIPACLWAKTGYTPGKVTDSSDCHARCQLHIISGAIWGSVSCLRILCHAAQPGGSQDFNQRPSDH